MADRVVTELPGLNGLYLRALRALVPGQSRAGDAGELPELVLPELSLDRGHLAAYRTVCGFTARDAVPATYPQARAFPLHLMLMTDDAFPFDPMGIVHIGNRIVQHTALSWAEPLELRVSAGAPAPHPRGRQLTVTTTARSQGAEVWRAEMLLLKRMSGHADATATSSPVDLPDEPPTGPQAWRLPSDLGRRYAAVSGDRNPIHLYDLTAKPLGFSHHIAHGMWTHARALAELENRLPDAFQVEVAFKRPIELPGSVRFGARTVGGATDFGVAGASDAVPHLVGRLR